MPNMPARVSNVACTPDFGNETLVRGADREASGTTDASKVRQSCRTVPSGVSQKIAAPEKFRYLAVPSR